jgi:hypothetical protein
MGSITDVKFINQLSLYQLLKNSMELFRTKYGYLYLQLFHDDES